MPDWFTAHAPAAPSPAAPPAPGGWFAAHAPPAEPEPEPIKPDGTEAMAAGVGLAGLAAAVPAARALAERIATSPTVSATVGQASRLGGIYSLGSAANDVVHGRNPLPSLLKNEGMRQAGKLAYRAAAPIAEGLGTGAAAGMAGGLAGLAGSIGFLGALQHDANRHVDIDYSKSSPDTDIATWLMNSRNAEANRGKTLEERQDDPTDVMFRPDDGITVTPETAAREALIAQLKGGQR